MIYVTPEGESIVKTGVHFYPWRQHPGVRFTWYSKGRMRVASARWSRVGRRWFFHYDREEDYEA